MKRNFKRCVWTVLAAACLTLSGPAVQSAMACPMCKAAAEEDDLKPRAYMYSIIFMLVVPGTLFSGITVGLVVMGRREAEDLRESGLTDPEPPATE